MCRWCLRQGFRGSARPYRFPRTAICRPASRRVRRCCGRMPLCVAHGLFHRVLPRHRIVGHHKIDCFQAFDLVAQAGGLFEFQVFGGLAHVGAQAVQNRLKVAASQRFVDLGGDAGLVGVALVKTGQDILDVLFDRRGGDPVFLVIGQLLVTAAFGFAHRAFHAAGDTVGVHDHAPVGVARGASDGLDQRGFRAQKALFVRVQNGDQPAFGNVQTLAQQVDPDQHVKGTQPQVTQDFDAFDGVDVAVHITHADALFVHVFGQIFGHALGQCGAQGAHTVGSHFAHLVQKVIDLHVHGADFDHRIDKAGGADHLFGEDAAGLLDFPCGGGCADEHRLRAHGVPFLELQRAVVHARRQPEPVFGQCEFAPVVAFVHAADLRHADVAFVGKDDGIVGDELEQGGGGSPGARPVR